MEDVRAVMISLRPRVSAERIAQRLDLSVESIRRAARLGLIPSYKIGRLVRFDPEEVEVAMVRRAHEPVEQAQA
jgi:excisionase family DNA binding protein